MKKVLFLATLIVLSCPFLEENSQTTQTENIMPSSIEPLQLFHINPNNLTPGDGSDWFLAMNEIPVDLPRGSLVYLASGSYGSWTFDTPVEDSLYVHLLKATDQDHGNERGWQGSMGSGAAVFSSLTIKTGNLLLDGASGGGPDNWDLNHGILIQAPWDESQTSGKLLVLEEGANQIRLRHLELRPIVTHQGYGHAIRAWENQNVIIERIYAHDIFGAFLFTRNVENYTITHSLFRNNLSTSAYHSEFHSDVGSDQMHFFGNRFEDIQGTAVFAGVNGEADNPHEDWIIEGNIFVNCRTNPVTYYFTPGDDENLAVNWRVVHNTFIGGDSAKGSLFWQDSQGVVVENNLWYGFSTDDSRIGVPPDSSQNNAFYDCTFYYSTLNEMDDSNLILEGNPFRDQERAELLAPSMIAIGTTQWQEDLYGTPRGADGLRDIGAVEFY